MILMQRKSTALRIFLLKRTVYIRRRRLPVKQQLVVNVKRIMCQQISRYLIVTTRTYIKDVFGNINSSDKINRSSERYVNRVDESNETRSLKRLAISKSDQCSNLVQHLASAQSEYLVCITKNAVPVSICISCKNQFSTMELRFQNLANNKNCTEKYFDHDRINLITTTQALMTELWNKAYCNDCYVDKIYEDFDKLIINLEDCLNIYHDSSIICKKCFETYDIVNSFYINLDQKHNGEICFDMQDKMNRTRFHWSKELKCCKRSFNKILFICVSSIVGALPVIFYYGIFAFTTHRERNHDVLYQPDTPRRSEPISQTVTSPPNITATESVQNSSPISKSKRMMDSDSDSDSDCSIDNKKKISK